MVGPSERAGHSRPAPWSAGASGRDSAGPVPGDPWVPQGTQVPNGRASQRTVNGPANGQRAHPYVDR
jgi:hypothetical protein